MKVGDIYYFKDYCFTDTGETKPHIAMIIYPATFSFANSIYSCVVTSQRPRVQRFILMLLMSKYKYLKNDSYACFDRLDMQPKNESTKKGEIDLTDIKKSMRIIWDCIKNHKHYQDKYLRAVLIRAWKRRRDLYPN